MYTNILIWLGIVTIILYFLIGYVIIKFTQNGFYNKNKEFEWSFKTIGYIIIWGPLLIISYIVLQFEKDKLNPIYKQNKED